MGHIKEPAGVDFVINSRPLTKKKKLVLVNLFVNIRQSPPKRHSINEPLKKRQNKSNLSRHAELVSAPPNHIRGCRNKFGMTG